MAGVYGSIPACAGEPRAVPPAYCYGQVYPRVCGGTAFQQLPDVQAEGLSPRVRGNPVPNRRKHLCVRSIPACAGEPCSGCLRAGLIGVYPRVCGGTLTDSVTILARYGLSPRVRGNHGD